MRSDAEFAVGTAEWNAWQDVCREFRAVVGEINDKKYKPLVKAIVLWSDLAHALRCAQEAAK